MLKLNTERTKNNLISAAAGGCTVAGADYLTWKYLARHYGKTLAAATEQFSPSEIRTCSDKINDAISISKLREKGVEFFDINPNNIEKTVQEINKRAYNAMNSSKIGRFALRILGRKKTGNVKVNYKQWFPFANGENAGYAPLGKSVIVNFQKFPYAIFHEMGHALNANSKFFAKTLAVIRHPILGFVPAIAGIALLKKEKPKSQISKGHVDKATTFIKKNAGKLTLACFVPTLFEEALASAKGASVAKKILNKDIVEKINSFNTKAWGTYALAAGIISGAVSFGVYVKDRVYRANENHQNREKFYLPKTSTALSNIPRQ